jgi:hypothetical protein
MRGREAIGSGGWAGACHYLPPALDISILSHFSGFVKKKIKKNFQKFEKNDCFFFKNMVSYTPDEEALPKNREKGF